GRGSQTLQARLTEIERSLRAMPLDEATLIAGRAHTVIGLPSKARAWHYASRLLGPMVARAKRTRGASGIAHALAREVEQTASGLLTDVTDAPGDVQLMNLHQTKGREA